MPQPFDYSVTPDNSAASGIGNALQAALAMQQGVEKNKLYQAEAQKNAQQAADLKAAAERRQGMYDTMGKLAAKPDVNGTIAAMTQYPELSEHFKQIVGALGDQQKQSRIQQASQVYASLLAGQPETAASLLDEQAAAHDNDPSAADDAKSARVMAQLIRTSPGTAASTVGLFLGAAMGPEKFGETFNKLQQDRRDQALHPAALTKAEAEAQEYATKARFAESNAIIDLQKKGWDIAKLQSDIDVANYNKKIAMMEIRIKQANSETERKSLELRREEFVYKRDNELRAKLADATATRTTIDNLLNTADKVLTYHEKQPDVVESAHGPVSSRLPTVSQDTADYEALVEQMGSQAFISQVQALKQASSTGATGLGQLTEKEGDKVEKALQTLSLKQSPKAMYEATQELQRVMLKMRKNITTKYGIPDTVPDTPAVTSHSTKGPGGQPMSTDDILRDLGVIK